MSSTRKPPPPHEYDDDPPPSLSVSLSSMTTAAAAAAAAAATDSSSSPSSQDSPQSDTHSLAAYSPVSPTHHFQTGLGLNQSTESTTFSSSSSSSSRTPRPGRTPSRYDWSKHKPTIKRLYIDEDKTLKDMLTIMARDHNFVATPRMVKTRLKKWGYSKNVSVKSDEVESLMELIFEAESQGDVRKASTAVTLATGRTVGLDRVAAHLRRKRVPPDVVHKATQLSLARYHRGGVGFGSSGSGPTSPTALLVDAPDIFRLPELIFSGVNSYVRGQYGSPGVLYLIKTGTREDLRVYDLTIPARKLLVQNKPDEALALLRAAPARIRDLLASDRPTILRCILSSVINLLSAPGGRELDDAVRALVRYVSAVAADAEQWSPEHPLRRLFQALSQASDQSLLEIAIRGYKCLLVSYTSLPGLSVRPETISAWLDLGDAVGFETLPSEEIENALWSSYQACAAQSETPSPEAVQQLFFMAELERQKVKARGISTHRLKQLLQMTLDACSGDDATLNTEMNCHYYLAGLYKAEGERDPAKSHFRTAIYISKRLGIDGATAFLMAELQGWLREWGEVGDVEEMQGEIVSKMSDMGLDTAATTTQGSL